MALPKKKKKDFFKFQLYSSKDFVYDDLFCFSPLSSSSSGGVGRREEENSRIFLYGFTFKVYNHVLLCFILYRSIFDNRIKLHIYILTFVEDMFILLLTNNIY